jgi:hypothetical protein
MVLHPLVTQHLATPDSRQHFSLMSHDRRDFSEGDGSSTARFRFVKQEREDDKEFSNAFENVFSGVFYIYFVVQESPVSLFPARR